MNLLEKELKMISIKMKAPEIEVVKLNLPASVVTYIIRAARQKKEVLLVSGKIYLYSYYRKFFDDITQGSFDLDLSFATKILYKLKLRDFQEYLVIGEDGEIIKADDKVINLKELKIEKNIVDQFFETIDVLQGLIVLKKEIRKIHANELEENNK